MDHPARSARSDRVSFTAINPVDGKPIEVYVTFDRLAWVAKRGKGAVLEASECVPHVLSTFKAIFEGLRCDSDEEQRGDSDGRYCYVGKPLKAFRTDGRERKPNEDEVFLVFVNAEGVAYNWRWEDEDPENPGFPKDWKTRFHAQAL